MQGKIASALALLTAAIHIFVGGADSLAPMLATDLPAAASGGMHGSWHIVSVFLVWSIAVFWVGKEPAFHFALIWIASALVFMYVGFYQAGPSGVLANPQWAILLPTGVLALLDKRR